MQRSHTTCGGCGRNMEKAHALVDDKGYCATCYKRDFKKVSCSKCGKATRSLHGVTPAVCKACRHAGKPCKRCGEIRPVGKVYEDGSISCPACVKQVDPPRPCAYCGTLTHHLSREFTSGVTEPACPKCRRKAHKQCPLCLKKQPLPYVSADGLQVCKLCFESGKKFVCPQCGCEKTRRNDKQCVECYWRDCTLKKMDKLSLTFKHQWANTLFNGLMNEVLAQTVSFQAFRVVNLYYKTFKKLDDNFERQELINSDEISEIFGRGIFLKHSRVIGYLISKKAIPTNFVAQLRESDLLLGQKNYIKRANNKWYQRILVNYYNSMKKKHERYLNKGWDGKHSRFGMITIKDRLYEAVSFFENIPSNVQSLTQIHQGHIDEYLFKKPRRNTKLKPLITYLNSNEKLFQPLHVEKVASNTISPKNILGQEKYMSLLKRWLYPENDDQLKESLICLFMLLYLQKGKTIVKLQLIDIIERDGCFGFPFGEVELMLDARISSLLGRYLKYRYTISRYDDARNNPYLFPGRHIKSHMSAYSVWSYLKRNNVTEAQLFTTGILKMYENGLDAPKLVEEMTGISSNTAYKYFQLSNPRLIDETNSHLKS